MGKSEAELERMADEFLAEHDPYHRSKKSNKRRTDEYPYLTATQMDEIERREIPISSLNKCQEHECEGKGMEVRKDEGL